MSRVPSQRTSNRRVTLPGEDPTVIRKTSSKIVPRKNSSSFKPKPWMTPEDIAQYRNVTRIVERVDKIIHKRERKLITLKDQAILQSLTVAKNNGIFHREPGIGMQIARFGKPYFDPYVIYNMPECVKSEFWNKTFIVFFVSEIIILLFVYLLFHSDGVRSYILEPLSKFSMSSALLLVTLGLILTIMMLHCSRTTFPLNYYCVLLFDAMLSYFLGVVSFIIYNDHEMESCIFFVAQMIVGTVVHYFLYSRYQLKRFPFMQQGAIGWFLSTFLLLCYKLTIADTISWIQLVVNISGTWFISMFRSYEFVCCNKKLTSGDHIQVFVFLFTDLILLIFVLFAASLSFCCGDVFDGFESAPVVPFHVTESKRRRVEPTIQETIREEAHESNSIETSTRDSNNESKKDSVRPFDSQTSDSSINNVHSSTVNEDPENTRPIRKENSFVKPNETLAQEESHLKVLNKLKRDLQRDTMNSPLTNETKSFGRIKTKYVETKPVVTHSKSVPELNASLSETY